MRRFSAALLFATALAPTALALASGAVDWEAIRCAARCGHAVTAGAICCPASASGLTLAACPPDEAVLVAWPPAVLGVAVCLALPRTFGRADEVVTPRLPSAAPAPPDHVPLSLS